MSDFKTVMAAYRKMTDITAPIERDFVRVGLEKLQLNNETRRGELNRSKSKDNGNGGTSSPPAPSSDPVQTLSDTDIPYISDGSLDDDDDAIEPPAKRPQPDPITHTRGANSTHPPSERGRHPSNHLVESDSDSEIEPTPKPASKPKLAPKPKPALESKPAAQPVTKPKPAPKTLQPPTEPVKQLRAPVHLEPVVPAKRSIAQVNETQPESKKSKAGWEQLLACLWAKAATGDVKFEDWGTTMKKGVAKALCDTTTERGEIERVVRLGMKGEGKDKSRKPTRKGFCLMAAAIS